MQDFHAYLATPYCSYEQLLQNNLKKIKLIDDYVAYIQ